jgi:FANCI solenoid 1/FANCI solenoid 2/FANCI helical domain 2/FANCI solenoid 4/FANCI helical domain 1
LCALCLLLQLRLGSVEFEISFRAIFAWILRAPCEQLHAGLMETNENSNDVSIDSLRHLYKSCHADFMKRISEFDAGESKRAQQRNKQIVSSVVALLHKGDISDKQDLERVLEKCQQVTENVAGANAPAIVEQLLRPLTSGALLHPQTPVHGAETLSVKGFAKSLDLLPRLLSLSRAENCVEEDLSGEADGMSGQEFHDHIISTMCSKKWPVGAGVALTATLKDLPLTDAQVKLAARSTLQHLLSLEDIEQLPALTFELLLLAGRPACREQIISGLILTFDSLGEQAEAADAQDQAGGFAIRHNAPPTAELRKIESKVLVQVSFAMRQDHELAGAVLRSFRKEVSPPSAAKVFTPFRAALLLTLARVQRFSAPALDACKELVVDCAQFQHKRASSKWFNQAESSSYAIVQKAARAAAAAEAGSSSSGRRRRVKREEHADDDDDDGSSQPELFPHAAVEQALLRTVQHCRAYDHLLPSLQDLGVRLMDQAKPAGKQGLGLYCHLKASAPLAAAHAAAQLGCAVLQECFATHAVMRRTIVLEALSRLKGGMGGGGGAAGAAAGSGSSVAVYIQLLAVLAERSPILLLEHAQALRDTFGYLGTLPSHAAQQLLLAVSPLLRLRPQLQDAVVLPLRKALFSGVEEARLVAVEGLILLLRLPQTGRSSRSNNSSSSSARAGFSFSQREDAALTQTQQGNSTSSSSSSGCAFTVPEGFSLLRRCLTQQIAVRSRLYAGLLAAFRDKGGAAALGSHTVSMLLGHFKRFVSLPAAAATDGERRGSAAVPLQLRRAIDDVQGVVEPLPQLIGVLFCLSCSIAASASAEQQADSSSSSSAAEDPLTTAVADISTHLSALITTMAAAEPEVFGLDCDCTFDAATKSGRAQLAAASLVLGVYEALMAGAMLRYQAVAQELAADDEKGHTKAANSAVRTVLALGERRLEVAELVRERVGGSSSKAKAAAASKGGKAGAAKGKGKQKKGSKAAAAASAADSDNDNQDGETEGGDAPTTKAAVAAGPAPVGGAHISPVSSFVLTLEPGGLPCLGLPFVQSMLQLLTAGTSSGSCTQQQQCDDAGSSSSAAVQRAQVDPALHRLLLETARSTLKVMRTGLAPPGGLTAAVGGGLQLRPPSDTPQSDSEAFAGWSAAARVCAVLAPLFMSEARRQTDAGQNSSAVADALATAADEETAEGAAAATKGTKGKKGKAKGKAGAPRKSADESLTELALSCFEECVLVAAAGPAEQCAKRVCKVLAAAHSSSESSSSSSSSGSSREQLFHDHAVWLLKQLQPMLRDGDVKEAEVLVRTLATVVPLLLRTAPSGAEAAEVGLDAFLDALVQLCSTAKVTNPSLVRSLVALLLSARLENGSTRGDMLHLADVALQVRVAVGPVCTDEDSEEAEQQQPKRASQAKDLSIIVPATAEAAAEAVISALEACTEAVELALAQLVKETTTHTAQQAAAAGAAALCSSSSSGGGASSEDEADSTAAALRQCSDSDEEGDVEARDPVDEREAFLSGRLRLLLSALDHLTQCVLRGKCVDRLLSTISRCFRVLGKALKARVSAKRYRVLRSTERLLEYKKGFTEHVTAFIGYVNSPECCETAAGGAARTARRAKLIPELVFQVMLTLLRMTML